jgi:hypothetical protein
MFRPLEPWDALICDLTEIDENLIRAELSELDKADHLAARKEIYERLYPKTRHGGDRKSDEIKKRNPLLDAPSFVDDTAAKTGMSPTVIRDAIRVASAIDPEIRDEIRGVPEIADKKAELDALSRMPPEQQREAVARVKSGEAKSVREPGNRVRALDDDIANFVVRSLANIDFLVELLEKPDGYPRLAAAIRIRLGARASEIGGSPKPDPELWANGRLG